MSIESSQVAKPVMSSGLSGAADTMSAAYQASEQCLEGLAASGIASPDLAIVFFSPHHLTSVSQLSMAVRRRLQCKAMIGVSTEGVHGGAQTLERAPGVSILAASLPGVDLKLFSSEQFPVNDGSAESLFALRDVMGVTEELRCTLFLADPFSTPLVKLLPAMNDARIGGSAALFGGMASASMHAGGNALLLDDRIVKYGGVGVSLSGPLRVDTLVSQGCKAYGPPMVITKAKSNLVLELGGKPAIEAIHEVLSHQGPQRPSLTAAGMYLGIAINEQKPIFGRDDFLIRRIIGVKPELGAVAVAELVKIGQTVRLHTRDQETAKGDLAMVLDGQKLHQAPAAVLLATSSGRGRRMFKDSPGDAATISRAFSRARAGEDLSKPGLAYYTERPTLPLAGFISSAEIAPIAGRGYMHQQTACLAIFRAPGE